MTYYNAPEVRTSDHPDYTPPESYPAPAHSEDRPGTVEYGDAAEANARERDEADARDHAEAAGQANVPPYALHSAELTRAAAGRKP